MLEASHVLPLPGPTGTLHPWLFLGRSHILNMGPPRSVLLRGLSLQEGTLVSCVGEGTAGPLPPTYQSSSPMVILAYLPALTWL